jgi:peptide/nickel transport system permease protein
VAGLLLVTLLLAIALVGPLATGANPDQQQLRDRLLPPVFAGGTWSHPLGTDQLGRDMLARIVAGARVSLTVGLTATVMATVIGVVLGLLAGGLAGPFDRLVAFAVDVQQALPFVVVAIGVVAVLGPSLLNVIVVLAVTGWVGHARIVRLQTRSLRHAAFVEAARAMGAGPSRLLLRHLLPNVTGPIIVIASQQIAGMILYEAALSYLGLGVPNETITWGSMIASGRETLTTAWWVSVLPGCAIASTILGFNLLGDWVQWLWHPAGRNGRSSSSKRTREVRMEGTGQ